MFYRVINNKKGFLFLALILSGIFVISEIYTDVPVFVEALLLSLAVLSFMIAVGNSGRMSDDQIRESLLSLSYSSSRVSGYASNFLNLYDSYVKRINVLTTVEYIDNRTTSLVKSIIKETKTFVDGRLKKAYGVLLVLQNKAPAPDDNDRIDKLSDAIINVLNRLDEIALSINEYGDSQEKYNEMSDFLQDTLDVLKELNRI